MAINNALPLLCMARSSVRPMPEFCPGYVNAPFNDLVANYPDETVMLRRLSEIRCTLSPYSVRGAVGSSLLTIAGCRMKHVFMLPGILPN